MLTFRTGLKVLLRQRKHLEVKLDVLQRQLQVCRIIESMTYPVVNSQGTSLPFAHLIEPGKATFERKTSNDARKLHAD